MFIRTALATSLFLIVAAHAAPTKQCDEKCKVEMVLAHNVGIPLDRPVTIDSLKKFGTVKADRTASRPNPNYPGKTDIVHTIAFDNIFVTAAVTPEKHVIVERIQQSNRARPLPFGITLGRLEDPHDFRKILGAPDETKLNTVPNGSEWVYSNTEGTETVTFVVQAGSLMAVIWDYTPGD